jgi:hypothetical protein
VPKIKLWTPINTKNPEEVEKHPLIARVQKFRNGWLIRRNEILTQKSARISMPKFKTLNTDERVLSCLAQLSEDLSKKRNKVPALGEIRITTKQEDWRECLTNLNFRKYTANQLQQLRKNSEFLLNEELLPNQRSFLTEVLKRVDSDLVTKKGYSHSKISPDKLLEISPPPDSPPPPLPEEFVEYSIDGDIPFTAVPSASPPEKLSKDELVAELEHDMEIMAPSANDADASPPPQKEEQQPGTPRPRLESSAKDRLSSPD